MVGDGKMPKGYVWTYVRKGEAGRLPEGWPNVVEIDRKDEDIDCRFAVCREESGLGRCGWGNHNVGTSLF